jgi:hypothetical protein
MVACFVSRPWPAHQAGSLVSSCDLLSKQAMTCMVSRWRPASQAGSWPWPAWQAGTKQTRAHQEGCRKPGERLWPFHHIGHALLTKKGHDLVTKQATTCHRLLTMKVINACLVSWSKPVCKYGTDLLTKLAITFLAGRSLLNSRRERWLIVRLALAVKGNSPQQSLAWDSKIPHFHNRLGLMHSSRNHQHTSSCLSLAAPIYSPRSSVQGPPLLKTIILQAAQTTSSQTNL